LSGTFIGVTAFGVALLPAFILVGLPEDYAVGDILRLPSPLDIKSVCDLLDLLEVTSVCERSSSPEGSAASSCSNLTTFGIASD